VSEFRTRLAVRFGHVDPAGIAYYPRLFDYVHEAFEDLWERHVGERYYDIVGVQGIGFPTVNAEVDFRRPLRFGDEPEIAITCFRLGSASLGLRYRFLLDDEVCLDARMTTVCVRLGEFSSLPIPDPYRAKFEQIRENL
jgi:4-hydroxybenzoyl-CoA thioesterase